MKKAIADRLLESVLNINVDMLYRIARELQEKGGEYWAAGEVIRRIAELKEETYNNLPVYERKFTFDPDNADWVWISTHDSTTGLVIVNPRKE